MSGKKMENLENYGDLMKAIFLVNTVRLTGVLLASSIIAVIYVYNVLVN
jgi:hypothetical protein